MVPCDQARLGIPLHRLECAGILPLFALQKTKRAPTLVATHDGAWPWRV